MTRRTLLSLFAAALVAPDPEKLLWRPGAKLISIPSPPFLAVGEIVTFGGLPQRYVVTEEARSLSQITEARFRMIGPSADLHLLPTEGLYTKASYLPELAPRS